MDTGDEMPLDYLTDQNQRCLRHHTSRQDLGKVSDFVPTRLLGVSRGSDLANHVVVRSRVAADVHCALALLGEFTIYHLDSVNRHGSSGRNSNRFTSKVVSGCDCGSKKA
jgi:hypothetical protein